MAVNLARLVVNLEAQTAQYQRELERANRQLDRFSRNTTRGLTTLKTAFKGLAAAMSVNAIVSWGREIIDAGNHADDFATRIGISVEALTQLQYAASTSGVSTQELEMSLQRMTRRLANAANGTGEAVKALQQMGLSAKALAQLAPDKQFEAIAEALDRVDDSGQRVALAMKIFDSEGVKLLQTMSGGASAVQKLREESDALGKTLSTETAKGMTAFNKKVVELETKFGALGKAILEKAMPALLKFIDVINDFFGVETGSQIDKVTKKIARLEEQIAKGSRSGAQTKARMKELAQLQLQLLALQEVAADVAAGPAGGGEDILSGLMGTTTSAADQASVIKAAADDRLNALKDMIDQEAAYLAENDSISNNVARLEDSLRSEEDMIRTSTGRRIELLADALERELITREKYAELTAKLINDQNKDLNDIASRQRDAELSDVKNFFTNLASLSQTESGKLTEIARASAIVNATISMYEGITNAMALKPTWMGMVMAASVGAQGAANIAAIAGARAQGGPVASGYTYLVGERGPELFTPAAGGNIVPNHQINGGGVTIIEDSSRAGQTTNDNGQTQVYIEAFKNNFLSDVNSGRGMALALERRYSLQRRAGA